MKFSTAEKKTLSEHYAGHYARVQDDGSTFMVRTLKLAGINAKEFAYQMRISKTYQQKLYRGEVPDYFERSREVCSLIAARNPSLVGMVLLHIAGDKFDGLILDPVKTAALAVLAGKGK